MRYSKQDQDSGHSGKSATPRRLTFRVLQGLVTASAFALVAMPGAIVGSAAGNAPSSGSHGSPSKERKPAKKPNSVEREAELRRRERHDEELPVQVSPEAESITHNPHVVAKAPEMRDAEFYVAILGAQLRSQIDPDIGRHL